MTTFDPVRRSLFEVEKYESEVLEVHEDDLLIPNDRKFYDFKISCANPSYSKFAKIWGIGKTSFLPVSPQPVISKRSPWLDYYRFIYRLSVSIG